MSQGYRKGELAKKAGVGRETIPFYESKGLISSHQRSVSGYRIYNEEMLLRMVIIRDAKLAGFSLKEVSEIINALFSGKLSKRGLRAAISKKIAEMDERVRIYMQLRKELKEFLKSTFSNKSHECHSDKILKRFLTN